MSVINTIKEILSPSTDAPVQTVNFAAGNDVVYGAEVTETAWFGGEFNMKVKYTFVGRDGNEHPMTQWVAESELI